MFRLLPLCLSLTIACAAHAEGQLYKWVGPDGKVTYSDTPPPAGKPLASRPLRKDATPAAGKLPFELAEAARLHPVTLYTTSGCPPCDEGRNLLTERGIPFLEKTVNTREDIAELKKVGNSRQLPLLLVGRNGQPGFETNHWHLALTAAGYPATSKLPRNYRHPAPQAAAGPEKPALQENTAALPETPPARSGATASPPAAGNAPPGFRF